MTVTLYRISPEAWQHPTDKVATRALASIPMLESLLRRLARTFGDRNITRLFQGSSLEVTPDQYGELHALLVETCRTLDTDVPRLFISESPFANAGAVGLDKPFIVVSSRLAEMSSDAEIRFVLGHEVGHIMAGHAIYRTIAILLTNLVVARSPIISAAMLPIIFALNEWSRKAELSCDRAGLIAGQDVDAAFEALARLGGGAANRFGDMNLEAVLAQSDDYMDSSGLDRLMRHLMAIPSSHPFPMVRIAELRKWIGTGGYHAIIEGDYPQRQGNLPAIADLTIDDDDTAADEPTEPSFSETAGQIFDNVDTYVTNALNSLIERISDWQDRSASGSSPGTDNGSANDTKKRPKSADNDPLEDYLDDWPMPQ